MKRFALLLALSTASCSSTPKTWRPNGFARVPGVPTDAFDQCANAMMSDTGRMFSGPAHAAGFGEMDLAEQDCVKAEYLRECLRSAHRTERANGIRLRPNAQTWEPDWQDFLDDAVDNFCDDQGGGTPRARGLVRVLSEQAEEAGENCVPCRN